MSATIALANALLDVQLGATTILPATVYVGLMFGSPASDGSGVSEPLVGAYARVGVANNPANWPAASGGIKTHGFDIIFPTATAAWGNLTHFGIFDALSGGNVKIYGPLDVPRNVQLGDTFRFLAGTSPLRVSLA